MTGRRYAALVLLVTTAAWETAGWAAPDGAKGATVQHHWATIVLARVGTRIDLPTDIFPEKRDPDNSDGATFRSPDGARLLVYGSWMQDEAKTPKDYDRWVRQIDPKRYAHVTYARTGRDFLVLSGTVGASVYYERYRFDDPSGARHALVLEYPRTASARYQPLVARISASLGWTKPFAP